MDESTSDQAIQRLPPEIICEIIRFVPSVPTFLTVCSLSSSLRNFIENEFPECAKHLTFTATNLSISSPTLPYVFSLIILDSDNSPTEADDVSSPKNSNKPLLTRKCPNLTRLRFSRSVLSSVVADDLFGDEDESSAVDVVPIPPKLKSLEFNSAYHVLFTDLFSASEKKSTRRSLFSNLTNFSASSADIRSSSMAGGLFRNLRRLEIEQAHSWGWNKKAFRSMPHLQKIAFAGCREGPTEETNPNTVNGLFGSDIFPKLEVLYLAGCYGLTLSSFRNISPTLRKFHMRRCGGFRAETEAELRRFLCNISDQETIVSDEAMEARFEDYQFQAMRFFMGRMMLPRNVKLEELEEED